MFGLNEALMSFIRRQVGLRTDTADANGSLHSKAVDLKQYVGLYTKKQSVMASNTIRIASTAEKTATTPKDAKIIMKTIKVYLQGTVRVSFDLRCHGGEIYPSITGYIYVNDGLRGEFVTPNLNYNWYSFSKDINVIENDLIHLEILLGTASAGSCRNFRIGYDFASVAGGVILH